MNSIIITPMQERDADRVSALASELGYPTTSPQIQQRFFRIIQKQDSVVQIARRAEQPHSVLGWIHFEIQYSLTQEPRVEILGLIVDEAERHQGIGKKLLLSAESWAYQKEIHLIRLSSRSARTEAHQFYKKQGFEFYKESFFFIKTLPSI